MRVAGLAAAFVFVIAGCGSATTAPDDGREALDAPPTIRAADRPAPDVLAWLDEEYDELDSPCLDSDQNSGTHEADGECNLTAAEREQYVADLRDVRREREEYFDAVRPAPDSGPRVVAELELSDDATAEVLAWRNAVRRLCTMTRILLPKSGSGGGPPGGECYSIGHCADVCLSTEGRRDVLSGTVAASGDVLRMTLLDDRVYAYPLVGPLVPGSDRRVFIVQLQASYWRRLELLRSGEVLEKVEQPPDTVEFERCTDEFGRSNVPTEEPWPEEMLERWRECVRGSKSGDLWVTGRVTVAGDRAGSE